jgi:DNA-binding MarR family transcriptional regulator
MYEGSKLGLCNCFATRQAARHITRLYEKHLADADVTSAQFSILVMLDERRRASMSDMADALVMDRTTLVRTLKPLQRDGLVTAKRGEGDGDRRQISFALTAAGRTRLKDAMRSWMSAQQEFEAQVGPARAARMRTDLLALEASA